MLSNCILSIFDTVKTDEVFDLLALWIAFKLYFIDLWHSPTALCCFHCYVVNCFQIVFYRSLTQFLDCNRKIVRCCELLSNCILSIFDTVCKRLISSSMALWIAFKLYFIDLWHSYKTPILLLPMVVNCFQIVFYRSLTQYVGFSNVGDTSCELLSNCILSIFDTVDRQFPWTWFRCELLSNCILSIFDTVTIFSSISFLPLWIAFKLYFIDLWHSNGDCPKSVWLVVNCFQIVFYRSLTQ